MRHIKKTYYLVMIFILVFQLVGTPVFAMSNNPTSDSTEDPIANADEDFIVPIFDDLDSSNIIYTVLEDTEVSIIESLEEMSLIEFLNVESDEIVEGYVDNDNLLYLSETDDLNESSSESEESNIEDSNDNSDSVESDSEKSDEGTVDDEADIEESEDSSKNGDTESEESGEDSNDAETEAEDPEEDSTEEDVDSEESNEESNNKGSDEVKSNEEDSHNSKQILKQTVKKQESLSVVGLRNPTNVREIDSTKSKVITSFPAGTIIELQTFSENWYEVSVDVNGEKTLGYIHHKHVDEIKKEQSTFQGIALKNPTNIRKLASTKSNIESSLPIGTIIDLETFSSNWYQATAKVDGKEVTGFIHHKHIGDHVEESTESFKAIAKNEPTNVRTLPSTKSQILTQLPIGSIVDMVTFSKHWYKVTVTVNGETRTGYIHKNHIADHLDSKQESFKGIGINAPTQVRELPSTKAKSISSLPIGSIINLKTLSKHWYEATIKVNGKDVTGYIHKNHIGDRLDSTQQTLKAYVVNNPTYIRVNPSTKSKSLTTLPAGSIINLKTLSKHWYEATVTVNGKSSTGYIHKNHINKIDGTQEGLYGEAKKSPTIIRSLPSTEANVSYKAKKGELIYLVDFSKHWYKATVNKNGKTYSGYVHKKHVDINTDKIIIKETTYGSYKSALDAQMKQSPQVSKPTGGFQNATRAQVEYYMNPSNFSSTSNDYYQFLVLSQPAGLDVDEVNNKILNNHGVLTGKAASFIKAGKQNNINEAYLISHAKLETGNGRSTLAKGVPVDKNGNIVDEKNAYKIVYNVYGIGAVDGNAIAAGAKRAFNEGWFTVEAAIEGGAKFINTYISRGQDTLYKMRWNPESPGYPQYATDIGWAVKQTTNIVQIYNLVDNYTLLFDVPTYQGQPDNSGDPNENIQVSLEVTASALNIRENAGTQYNVIATVQKGTKLLPVLDSKNNLITKKANDHVWYQIYHKDKKYWVSGGKNGTELVKVVNP